MREVSTINHHHDHYLAGSWLGLVVQFTFMQRYEEGEVGLVEMRLGLLELFCLIRNNLDFLRRGRLNVTRVMAVIPFPENK